MLSNTRRALTPNESHTDDKNLAEMSIDNSSTAPNLHLHDSSPPQFSPLQPRDLSSSPDREHEVTDDSLLGPVTADTNEDSHYESSLSMDGASEDHLQPRLEDTHSQSSLLPTAEPAQSTSKSQRAHRTPTPRVNNVASEPRSISDPQPFNPLNKASPEKTPRPQDIGHSTSTSARASAGPEQSVAAAADEPKMPSPSQVRQSKQNGDDNPLDLETKEAKKPRRQASKEEASAATEEQQDAASDDMPKKRGRPKKGEGSTTTVKKQAASRDELPKKRGRPKNEERSTTNVKQQAASRDELPKKRGRPKNEEGSTTTVKQQAASRDELPKKRGRPKNEEGSTTNVKQQAASRDELPKKRGRPKNEEGSTTDVKQQAASRDELPKKRGRPKEDQGSAREAKSHRTSKEDTPAKRGRPKKEAAPTQGHTKMKTVKPTKRTAAPIHQDRREKKIPKQRGGATEGAEPAGIVQPADVPAADATKKRGRPKKGVEATQGIENQVVPIADTPRKRGGLRNDQDVAGSSKAETPKKRGRPKTIGQIETPKISTPAKRGRPKKEQATPKGAKPVGIVKKKSGRK